MGIYKRMLNGLIAAIFLSSPSFVLAYWTEDGFWIPDADDAYNDYNEAIVMPIYFSAPVYYPYYNPYPAYPDAYVDAFLGGMALGAVWGGWNAWGGGWGWNSEWHHGWYGGYGNNYTVNYNNPTINNTTNNTVNNKTMNKNNDNQPAKTHQKSSIENHANPLPHHNNQNKHPLNNQRAHHLPENNAHKQSYLQYQHMRRGNTVPEADRFHGDGFRDLGGSGFHGGEGFHGGGGFFHGGGGFHGGRR